MSSSGGIVGAIPARYASTRLPGKMLREIAGRPMIRHVVERVSRVRELERVVVLTDDERIAGAVRDFGGEAEMTPEECASGTDRIAWAAKDWDARAVINVQGDEPLIDPEAVARLARHLRDDPDEEMATLAAPLDPSRHADPNAVKVVRAKSGHALYFSRAPIPHRRDPASSDPDVVPLLHVGIYGYRRDVLLRLAGLEPTPLERCEALEQLRALENGIRIRVLLLEHALGGGVDTEDDLREAERILSASSTDHPPRAIEPPPEQYTDTGPTP